MFKKFKRWLTQKGSLNPNKIAKKEQAKYAAIILFILGVALAFYMFSSEKKEVLQKKEVSSFDGSFDSVFNQASDEALIEKQQHELDELKNEVAKTNKKQKALQKKEASHEDSSLLEEMKQKLMQLEEDNKNTKEALARTLIKKERKNYNTPQDIRRRMRAKEDIEREWLLKSGLETVQFNHRQKNKDIRNSKNYVWAGSFVQGTLLTGIMGDAGINGSKNMGTVLIRLDSEGIMPNDKQSHLKGCSAIASSFGDLSATSVVLHLETLSCAGSIVNFEQKVYGSVFDGDAMPDLRGTAILKTKPLLTYSAAAGILAGIGDGLRNVGTLQSVTPATGSITTYNSVSSIAQSAAGGGISNPANRISDYVMKIADIYHPLVVARPGRHVSLLFTKGFWIDKEHQVYESEKSLDDKEGQQSPSVITTISHGSDSYDAPITEESKDLTDNAPNLSSNIENKRAEELFLQQNGLPIPEVPHQEGVNR